MITTKEALKQVPLFSNLADGELESLSKAALVKEYDKNDTIIHKADEGDSFFSLVSGRVKVVLTDDEGKEFIVGILQPLEFFGEMALLDGEPRSASVVAIEKTEVVVLKRDDFLRQFTTNPEMAKKVISVLGRRLRHANEHIESLVFLDVCGRLARVLLDMAAETGKSLDDGIEFTVTHSRTELANLVGTTRETLTRALKTLETMGYIRIKKNTFVITNTTGLKNRMY
jgi:CRP/FNR family transcriptional regulator, cyclic AMP receptor protein